MRARILIFLWILAFLGCGAVPWDMPKSKTRPVSQALTPVIEGQSVPAEIPSRRLLPHEYWAVWHPEFGFLLDTCAGGTFSGPEAKDWDAEKTWMEALVWTAPMEAWAAVDAADIPRQSLALRTIQYTPPPVTPDEGEPRSRTRAKLKK